MKPIFLTLCLAFFLFGCKKENNQETFKHLQTLADASTTSTRLSGADFYFSDSTAATPWYIDTAEYNVYGQLYQILSTAATFNLTYEFYYNNNSKLSLVKTKSSLRSTYDQYYWLTYNASSQLDSIYIDDYYHNYIVILNMSYNAENKLATVDHYIKYGIDAPKKRLVQTTFFRNSSGITDSMHMDYYNGLSHYTQHFSTIFDAYTAPDPNLQFSDAQLFLQALRINYLLTPVLNNDLYAWQFFNPGENFFRNGHTDTYPAANDSYLDQPFMNVHTLDGSGLLHSYQYIEYHQDVPDTLHTVRLKY